MMVLKKVKFSHEGAEDMKEGRSLMKLLFFVSSRLCVRDDFIILSGMMRE